MLFKVGFFTSLVFATFSSNANSSITDELFSGAWSCTNSGFVSMKTTTVYHIDGSYEGAITAIVDMDGKKPRIKIFIKGTWRIEDDTLYELNDGFKLIPMNQAGTTVLEVIENDLAKMEALSETNIISIEDKVYTYVRDNGGEKSCYRP